jgi:hypothetical protein
VAFARYVGQGNRGSRRGSFSVGFASASLRCGMNALDSVFLGLMRSAGRRSRPRATRRFSATRRYHATGCEIRGCRYCCAPLAASRPTFSMLAYRQSTNDRRGLAAAPSGRRDVIWRSDGLLAPKGHSHNSPGQSAAAQPRSAALGSGMFGTGREALYRVRLTIHAGTDAEHGARVLHGHRCAAVVPDARFQPCPAPVLTFQAVEPRGPVHPGRRFAAAPLRSALG